jgi:hypothetical protein
MIKKHILAGCHELTDTQKAFIGAQQVVLAAKDCADLIEETGCIDAYRE